MKPFSMKTLKLLGKAGWHSNRKTDIGTFITLLRGEGYSVTKNVEKFLIQYGKLKIRQKSGEYFHFDVQEGCANTDPGWIIEEYSNRVGNPLCIIGEAFNGNMTLCMSPKSEVYAGFDDSLSYVGESGEEAIEILCSGRALMDVPELNPELSDELKKSIEDAKIGEIKSQLMNIKNLPVKQSGIIQNLERAWRARFKSSEYVLIPKLSNSTIRCLKEMLKANVILSGEGIVFLYGIHPKGQMNPSEISEFITTSAKKKGLYINKNNIKTAHIPNTKYTLTAFMEFMPKQTQTHMS